MLAPLAAALLLAAAPRAPGFVAVVDPGHGGDQEGALSPLGDKEKDVALEIARRVAARLRAIGGKVVLTRTGDIAVPLANRAAIANALRADLFVSVHLNSMPSAEARRHLAGVETYFLSADATDASATAVAARENADRLAGEPVLDPADPVAAILQDLEDQDALAGSSRLAYAVHEKLVGALGAEDRGVKQAPFYVLAGARMPAVLLEVGFISHDGEAARLRTPAYQERIAAAVAEGVAAWRNATRRASR
ncbi:N-acetylmuramoyl-L-alanine amidase family protein [Anaeromyxobacter terrae]|uniref:N-acetylmuramoyl-L-alanine amidase family protein n=1 Tax=Anaeromyxobacter terrae TaxID=2925406 RepID=UPI001F56733E|nr:N-acetylmuramoyl-L-alanine amidase [Anaeromyxobacter sp. SG22]